MNVQELEKTLDELRDWLANCPDTSDREACLRHHAKHDQIDASIRDAIKESEDDDWWLAAGESDE